MIDWLNIEIPLHHDPIPQGRRMVIDHDGSVKSEFLNLRRIEEEFDGGSYKSSISVSSIDNAYTRHRFPHNPEKSTGIAICGNPTKFLQGHNVFGSSCIKTLVYRTVTKLMLKLNFPLQLIKQTQNQIINDDFRVTRIDITHMFDIGTNQDVENYLRMMRDTVTARGDRCEYDRNTFYVGKHSTVWALKFYNKLKEITSRSKQHRLADHLPYELFQNFTDGQLRVELVLRKKELTTLDLLNPKILQTKLHELFTDYTGRLEMKNQRISERNYLELSKSLQKTIAVWRTGTDMRIFLTDRTFYRHRRELLEVGIDIKNPPVSEQNRVAIVKPVKVLAPKQITEIPLQLQKYLVKDIDFNERKVA